MYCPQNKRRPKTSTHSVPIEQGTKFLPDEKLVHPDRIRSSLDDTRWVYRLDKVTEHGVHEVARVYGWKQIQPCVESLNILRKDRIIVTPLYPLR